MGLGLVWVDWEIVWGCALADVEGLGMWLGFRDLGLWLGNWAHSMSTVVMACWDDGWSC